MTSLREEMIALYRETMNYKFQKTTYEDQIEKLKGKYRGLLEGIAENIAASEDAVEVLAAFVPEYVSGRLASVGSKRKRSLEACDHNMNMVAWFMPVIGETPSDRAKELTEKMTEIWNKKMPDARIMQSTYEGIKGGFRKGLFCYITTAVCRSLDKPDDCYELTLLRKYRDEYLLENKDGQEIVHEYYNIAPTIVRRIDRDPQSDRIYRQIWEEYLNPCICLIETGQKEKCKDVYSNMVRELETKYLYS